MHFRKLPLRLRRRITDYYENRYQGKMFNEKTVLAELNPILRSEMISHNCESLVENVPFFSDADSDFTENIIQRLNFEMYLMDDEIIKGLFAICEIHETLYQKLSSVFRTLKSELKQVYTIFLKYRAII
jgi:hypothetical protein